MNDSAKTILSEALGFVGLFLVSASTVFIAGAVLVATALWLWDLCWPLATAMGSLLAGLLILYAALRID